MEVSRVHGWSFLKLQSPSFVSTLLHVHLSPIHLYNYCSLDHFPSTFLSTVVFSALFTTATIII